MHLGGADTPGLEWAIQTCEAARATGLEHVVLLGDVIDKNADERETFPVVHELVDTVTRWFSTTVFIAGNHDVHHNLKWMHDSAVTVAGVEPCTIHTGNWAFHTAAVRRDGDDRHLLENFPDPVPAHANVGLLHTSVSGEYSKRPCLPCDVSELQARCYDAWVLGHVHQRHVLSRSPFIGWVGQGRALSLHEVDGRVEVRDFAS